jgi:hypothetical protein
MNETDSHPLAKNNSIGSPSSPSSLSSASSTTSSHSSSHTQSAVQAAVQALLAQQQQPGLGLLTSSHQDTSSSASKSNLHAIQQQQQLNQLLASIAAAQQQHTASHQSTSALLNNLMQQQLELATTNAGKLNSSNGKPTSSKNLNVKTKASSGSGRALKGNSVSPPGTSSTCSDQDHHDSLHSPSNSAESLVKNEPNYNNSADTPTKGLKQSSVKSEFEDLDRSTNSSASQDQANAVDDDDDLHDDLDDYETSFSRDSKRHRNHSTSSRTHSSNPHSRSTSPSSTSYHDSPAAFPTLESATAMLGGLNCTPNSFLDTSMEVGMKKRRLTGSDAKKIKPVPADKKDDAYWERRRKNNEAAKRSRDLRRQKEDEIAVKATVLEQENLKLKAQVTILKAELSKLHFMLYNR